MRLLRLQRQVRKMNQLERYLEKLVAEQASDWVEVMRDPGMLDRMVFTRWLKKHDRHACEYLTMEAIDHALRDIDPLRQRSVDELLAGSDADVISLPAGRDVGSKRRHRLRTAGLAAAAVAAMAVAAWWQSPYSGWQTISTAAGEQRVVELDDGSTVYLNTRSKLRVRLSAQSRDLQLVSGEALFDVERDPARPFLVRAGETIVQALGTQFNVYQESESTRVTVLEGKVEVSARKSGEPTRAPTLLSMGEEVAVPRNAPLVKNSHPDLAKTVAWRQRRVVFRLDTLTDIAAEFNRYNRTPQIRVEGGARQACCFSGVFDADDPQAFARMLGRDGSLSVQESGGEIVIRSP